MNPALASTAAALGIPVEWLAAQVAAESGGNPRAYNKSTGATGLIQWIPRTMKQFGFLPSDVAARIPSTGALSEALKREVSAAFLARYPDFEHQARGPLLTYLKQYAPFPTKQSLYLAVFYPAYRNKPLETSFPDSVRAQNPGIDTVGAYVRFVDKKLATPAKTVAGLGAIALGAAAAFLAFK